MARQYITMRLEPKLLSIVDELAESRNITRTALVEMALNLYLDSAERIATASGQDPKTLEIIGRL
jgi:predicted transcriptional regulator